MNRRAESGGRQGEGEQARKEAGVRERIEEAPSGDLLDVHEPFELADELAGGPSPGAGGGALRGVVSTLNALVCVVLNVVVAKPVSIFVWWLYAGGNRTTFHGRAELARRVARARMAGRPVLFASNHLSMFDDPVVPMALFRTGARAAAELLGVGALLVVWWVAAPMIGAPEVVVAAIIAYSVAIAVLGARKTWWSIGDFVNFGGASALRGKLEFGRGRPLSIPLRLLLAVADPVIFFFMRSVTVKTVLVDRRRGEEGRRSRLRGVRSLMELAAAGEQIWVFFEGGRARNPDQIRSARRGIGWMVEGLQGRGIRPVVFAIHHRGLEHVIPMSSRRWITLGNRIDIRWSECEVENDQAHGAAPRDAQQIADDIRAAVVRLQSDWRSEQWTDA